MKKVLVLSIIALVIPFFANAVEPTPTDKPPGKRISHKIQLPRTTPEEAKTETQTKVPETAIKPPMQQTAPASPPPITIKQDDTLERDETTRIPTYFIIIVSILAALIGAVVSSVIMAITGLLQRSRQRKALLVAFTTDLVERFMQATMYYNQIRQGSISYSALYEATNPNTLERLAAVIKDQDIIHTIVELQGGYYQIQRHVLEASKFVAELGLQKAKYVYLKRTLGPEYPKTVQAAEDLRGIIARAHGAQSLAIAFFKFDEMFSRTKALINYTKKHAGGRSIVFLEKKLNQKIKEKEEVDSKIKEKYNQRLKEEADSKNSDH